MPLTIPARLAASCRNNPKSLAWLASLPGILKDAQQRWALSVDAPFDCEEVSAAWVAPTRRANGMLVILKAGLPHMEGEHEIAGLRFWNGNPTVRLLEADEALGLMLLERCQPGIPLRTLPEPEQDVIVARLLNQLWRTSSPTDPFRPLSALIEHWNAETRRDVGRWVDPGLVRDGLAVFEQLVQTSSRSEVLLATDLHAGNILQAEREPWLVIDPKPFVGDPGYDVTQHLLNCQQRLQSDPKGLINRLADLASLDRERVRLWTFARAAADPRPDWNDLLAQLARRISP